MRFFFISILLLSCTYSQAQLNVAELPEEIQQKTKCLNKQFLISSLPSTKSTKTKSLFIFLHGMGMRSDNISKLQSMAKLVTKNTKKYDMLTVIPQCLKDAKGKGWWDNKDLNLLLTHLKKIYNIDEKRIYLTGFSMGGFGTWAWAMDKPDVFAAIAPMAGGGNPKNIKKLKNMHIWAFHGKKDKTVKYEKTKILVDALIKAKSTKVEFTTYPDQGHGIVMETLKNPQLYRWFSEKSK